MSFQAVEWILVVKYNVSAHRAVYGRLTKSTTYTKDYIQLIQGSDFQRDLRIAFPSFSPGGAAIPITYRWPSGHADGSLVPVSADRPHLKWGTSEAPPVWRMSLAPGPATVETIFGDPDHKSAALADAEHRKHIQGHGQPYLVAVKLFGEIDTLHLRVHIENPSNSLQWADIAGAPPLVQNLALSIGVRPALKWHLFRGPQDPDLVYFDPSIKGNPWSVVSTVTSGISPGAVVTPPSVGPAGGSPGASFPSPANTQGGIGSSSVGGQSGSMAPHVNGQGANAQHSQQSKASGGQTSSAGKVKAAPQPIDRDAWAEGLESSEEEVKEFEDSIDAGDYEVPDAEGRSKIRGSAQRAFAKKVKDNYGWRCALTGICTTEFLIASHIVPWSVDKTIRLDPSNGICLSVFVDRAFEHGYIVIEDDYKVHIVPDALSGDPDLAAQLAPYDGVFLKMPSKQRPNPDYLRRRRSL